MSIMMFLCIMHWIRCLFTYLVTCLKERNLFLFSFLLACLLTYLPTCLLTFFLSCLLTYFLSLLVYFLYLLVYLLPYILTYVFLLSFLLLAYLIACLLVYLLSWVCICLLILQKWRRLCRTIPDVSKSLFFRGWMSDVFVLSTTGCLHCCVKWRV